MALIREQDRKVLQERLQDLAGPVDVEVFTRDMRLFVPGRECPGCEETVELMKELAQLHPSIRLQVRDIDRESQRARELGVERPPTVVLHGRAGGRVRFVGPPLGYEFATLVEALIEASAPVPAGGEGAGGDAPAAGGAGSQAGHQAEALALLGEAGRPVHLRVFFTPT